MTHVKAILVDPETRTLRTVWYNGTLEEIRQLLGCRTVTCAPMLGTKDSIYADDEGLYAQPLHLWAYIFAERDHTGHVPMAGRGLIVGPPDDDGEETDCTTPMAFAKILCGGVAVFKNGHSEFLHSYLREEPEELRLTLLEENQVNTCE